jgi:hypothetical protein
MTEIDPDQHRRNVRLAWAVGAFALAMFLSAIPFWRGLYHLITQQQ